MAKLSKFQWAIIFGISLVILVSWIDIQGFNLLGEKYTQGDFPSTVWPHHLITALILFLIPAVLYWTFYRKDKSEFFAIFLAGFTMFYFLLADVFYFWLQGKSIPPSLPWLINHPIAGNVAKILNLNIVTPLVLYVSVAIGLIVVYFGSKILKEKL